MLSFCLLFRSHQRRRGRRGCLRVFDLGGGAQKGIFCVLSAVSLSLSLSLSNLSLKFLSQISISLESSESTLLGLKSSINLVGASAPAAAAAARGCLTCCAAVSSPLEKEKKKGRGKKSSFFLMIFSGRFFFLLKKKKTKKNGQGGVDWAGLGDMRDLLARSRQNEKKCGKGK